MKVKLETLVGSREGLSALLKTKLKAKVALMIARTIQEANKHIEAYEQVRIAKVKEYGVLGEDNKYNVSPENIDTYFSEMGSVLEQEVEVAVVRTITSEELITSDGKEIDIEPEALVPLLDWLIK